MKFRLIVCWLVLSCVAILPQLDAQNPKDVKDKKEPEKTDITDKVREMNSNKFASPPTEFRTGHVNPKMLDAKATKKTDGGFIVKLPSGAPIPTPTVYNGKLFVSGGFSTKEYFCLDAVDGKCVWGMSLDDDGPTSAVVADDIVVFNTESCTIFALDAKTGKHLWSYFLGDPLTSTPAIANGKVFTSYPAMGGGGGGGKGNQGKKQPPAQAKKRPDASHVMICLELKTGKILWQKWIDSDVMSAPVAVDDEVYATSFAGTVYKFKQNDGTIVSAHRSRATSAPLIVGNNVYWTQRADGKGEKCAEEICGLDRQKTTQNFTAAKREAVYLEAEAQARSALGGAAMKLDAGNGFAGGAPEAANGKASAKNVGQASVSSMQSFQGSRILNFKDANYNCMGDELINTDPKDGKIRWKVKVKGDLAKEGGHLAAPPAAAGGYLFLTTLEGEVLQVDPENGKVAKTYKVGSAVRSQAAIDGGRIYVGTQDGKLVCIDTGDSRFTGWATWGANMAHTNIVEAAKK
jgi:Ca-activated chloride channel homolog